MSDSVAQYSVAQIANYFLRKGNAEGDGVDAIKLQKLLFFAQAHYLGEYGKPLYNEEIEAWDYGPVVSSIYHQFKGFGRFDIEEYAFNVYPVKAADLPSDEEDRKYLDKVWDFYSHKQSFELVKLTHEKGGPWRSTINRCYDKYGNRRPMGVTIKKDDIEEFYKERSLG